MAAPVSAAHRSGVGLVTFDAVQVGTRERAQRLLDELAGMIDAWLRHSPGFVSARLHLSLDGTTVVQRGEWVGQAEHREASRLPDRAGSLADWPGVLSVRRFEGTQAGGIDGPAATEVPGLASMATRYVGSHASAQAVAGLLRQTGEWKRHSPGFVAATPYVSRDGRTYVNYPQWVDQAAYDAYMDDPRLAEALQEVARHEVAPPEFVLCRVVTHVNAPSEEDSP